MGPKPSSLHGREVGWAGFGVQWSFRAIGHLGPIRKETGVDGGGGRVKKRTKKRETDGGERTRDSVGQSDKRRRRYNKLGWQVSFVMKP